MYVLPVIKECNFEYKKWFERVVVYGIDKTAYWTYN